MIDISKIYFHDATITGMAIKTVEDHFDTIRLFFKSPMFVKDFGSENLCVILNECYHASMELNMGISRYDSVDECTLVEDSTLIKEIRRIYSPYPMKLIHFHLSLNTSGSQINIAAREIDIYTTCDE